VLRAPFDPAHGGKVKSTDVDARTLFSTPDLRFIAVAWAWALVFKLVCYAKDDPADACAIVLLLY
jgi:hypothetical protein